MTVVVFQTAYLGDMVLTTPLLEALARRHGPVDVVTTPDAASVIDTLSSVHAVLPYDKRGAMRGAMGAYRMAREVARRRYSLAYLPHRSISTALIARVAGIPLRIGFDGAPGRWWYTSRRRRAGDHEAARLRSLAGDLSGPALPSIALTPADRRVAADALRSAGIDGPFVTLAPGSAWYTKRWPRYRELAHHLRAEHGIVCIGSSRERGIVPCGTGDDKAPAADLAGTLTVRQSAAVIAASRALVANDSLAMHLAQAVGTPVVAIYGPTTPQQGFGPQGTTDRVVQVDGLPCRPCGTHGADRCPLSHHRCMREIAPAAVASALAAALNEHRSDPMRRTACAGS